MEILDKKSNRMSRVIIGVSERSEFLKLQRILDFLSLRNLTIAILKAMDNTQGESL